MSCAAREGSADCEASHTSVTWRLRGGYVVITSEECALEADGLGNRLVLVS